jgi:predicted O-methyltransferase YrrM
MLARSAKLLFRPFEKPEDAARAPFLLKKMRHPVFSWLGLRPVFAQHTLAEHEALKRWGSGKRNVVEIGVAEGGSACALPESISPEGVLHLIDPFHLSRFRAVNAERRAAHAAVARSGKCRVEWIEEFSQKAAANWSGAIDLLFIDGDHKKEAVVQDWIDWSPFLTTDGVVLFHDARVFAGGWPTAEYGPVQAINELFRTGSPREWNILEEVDSLVVVGCNR